VGSAKSERNHRKTGVAPKKRRPSPSSGGGANRANRRSVAVGFVEVEGTSQDLSVEAAEVTRKRKDPPKKRRRSSVGGAKRANRRIEDVGSVEVEGTSRGLAAEVTRKRKDPSKKKKRRKMSVVGGNRANERIEDVGSVEVEGTSQDLAAEAAEVTRKPRKKRMSVLAKKKMRGIQRRKRKRERAERFVQKISSSFL
jgi:hypothetical protein